jgi:PucR family transcriptional regulator, purine catabolism regulatory protein
VPRHCVRSDRIIPKESKNLTVADILKSPFFKRAIFAAGKNGLPKNVTWVHIIDSANPGEYCNGGELILTTGAGWKTDDDPISFLRQLIEAGATALCIQMGEKFNRFRTASDIPAEMIETAELNSFPLILFPEDYDCRYVDLVHTLHSMIINKNYKIFLEQEKFLSGLYQVMINPHDTEDILRFLHGFLDAGIAYIPVKGKALFVPAASKPDQQMIVQYLDKARHDSVISLQKNNLSIAYRRVNAYQQDLGCLVIFSDKHKLGNFDYLVLEKSSVVLAQEFLGSVFMQEKERQRRQQWVSKWLSGRLKSQDILRQLQTTEPFLQPTGVAACIVQHIVPQQQQKITTESMLNITGIARSLFEQQGFFLLWLQDYQSLVYILIDSQSPKSWKFRLEKAIQQIKELFLSSELNDQKRSISLYVGKYYADLSALNKSLENAKEVSYILENTDCTTNIFYDDLHIFRIIMMLENNGELNDFIRDYLGPLIENNNKFDKNLLKTLTALRDCQYNKKEAAEKLFIARQSMYQRIKSLEEIFGDDFITLPEKRICIEIALYGLEFTRGKQ